MELVSTRLMGRLGNQLFQYSVAIGYAIKHKIEYCVPLDTLNNNVWNPYYFENICYCEKEKDGFFYKEPKHSYNEIPYIKENVLILEGYWQSEKYFYHCREQILNIFGFNSYTISKGVIGLHLRIGDYKLYPEHHPIVSDEYLSSAMDYFYKNGFNKFIVFSDSIDECKIRVNNKKYPKYKFIYTLPSENPIEDLLFMSSMEGNIISNSSYSWWAAWGNTNPDKIIVAPKIWFGKKNFHLDTKDLIPESWITM